MNCLNLLKSRSKEFDLNSYSCFYFQPSKESYRFMNKFEISDIHLNLQNIFFTLSTGLKIVHAYFRNPNRVLFR